MTSLGSLTNRPANPPIAVTKSEMATSTQWSYVAYSRKKVSLDPGGMSQPLTALLTKIRSFSVNTGLNEAVSMLGEVKRPQ